ncbi:MAG: hypothetical protein K5Q00_00770 [Gammaproteobacteria bacterium]|nr:hypothetical protein [Gammaproteobacteria bacterium]
MRKQKMLAMKLVRTMMIAVVLVFSGISYAADNTAASSGIVASKNLPQDAQVLIDGSLKVGTLTADQASGLKTWLASNTTPNDALFIILGLTYRSLILNPTQNLKMTATYYKMTNGLTLPMLNLFKVLYQRYNLLPADKMQQLDDVIKQKQAQQPADTSAS